MAQASGDERGRLTIVGSGDAFNAAGRGHSCYLLEGQGCGPVMIDFGATALQRLRDAGRDPREVKAWVFTHLHGDHIGGFPYLLIDGMFNGVREEPLRVIGPVGTRARLDALLQITYGDIMDRARPFELQISELAPGERIQVEGMQLHGFPADHMDPPEQPLCLRFEMPDGLTVAFSGDTSLADGLRAAAVGADWLVAECSGMQPPCGRHCTWQEWRQELPRIGSAHVVLSHLGEAVRAQVDALLAEAPAGVDLRFADDGLVIPL